MMPNNSTKRLPLSVQIQETLHRRIVEGDYTPGEWLPPERELAEELSVSRPMVRAALLELQRRGIIERDPHCRPRVPKHRRERKPNPSTALQTIAAILPQQPNYSIAHSILRGITGELRQQEATYDVTVMDTHQEISQPKTKEWEVEFLERLEKEPVAGIIIWHYMHIETLPALLRLHDRGVPIVFIDRFIESLDCDYVGVDNRAGMRHGIEYLLGLGHRRIALLMDNPHISAVSERKAGYHDALWNAGIMPDTRLIRHAFQSEDRSIRHDLLALAELPEPPTALAASNDLTAFEIMTAAKELGWRIPQDVSLLGFDDIESGSPHPAILTTIHQPFFEVGQQAAALLLHRLRDGGPSVRRTFRQLQLPTRLVIRSTCDKPSR